MIKYFYIKNVILKIGIDARFFTEQATWIGRHVFELVKFLAKNDTQNNYILFLNKEQFSKFELPSNKFTKELTEAKHYSFDEQFHFLKQINKHNFDLMVFPHFNAPIFYNKPFVVTIHDLTLHLFPGKKKTDFFSRLAYKLVIKTVTRKAKHCFAVSENTKQDMINFLKLKEDKITVTYNWVSQKFIPIDDYKILEQNKKEYNLPKQYFLYTWVQRSHKNIKGLIQAYKIYCKNNPSSTIELVIAWPKDKTYTEIPDLINSLDLENRVHLIWLFPEKDFCKLICWAEAYIFPSFYEGFWIPPLEAMQCWVPVASSNTSSLPEVCGEAVEYFNPYKIEEIANAMEIISTNEKRIVELIKKWFIQCKKFKWEDMGEKMLKIYNSINKW